METTTKVEDVHAQFETLERKIAYAAEYYVNNACDFSDIPSEQIEQMKEMVRGFFTQGGYAVAALLMSMVDVDAVQKWAESDRTEEYVEPYDTMFRKVARAAYLDGVRDYAKFVNDSVGITLTRVDHEV